MMRKIWLALITLVMFFSLSTSAIGSQKPSYDKADKNDNGKVSIQEAVKAGAKKDDAKLADINEDGKLTKNDWEFVEFKKDKTKKDKSNN